MDDSPSDNALTRAGRIERLLASSPAVLYSFEATGSYAPTFISENLRDLFGYEPSEYLESSMSHILPIRLFDFIFGRIFGVYKSMDEFKGH